MIVRRPKPIDVSQAIRKKSAKEYEEWTYDFYDLRRTERLGLLGQNVSIAVLDTGVPVHDDIIVHVGCDMRYQYVSDNAENYKDRDGHATHLGGILFAQHNGYGVKGLVPRSKAYFLKVLGDDGSGTDYDVATGIKWSRINKIDIIVMSLGSDGETSEVLNDEIERYVDEGGLIFAASGNDRKDNNVDSPANHPMVIAVGSHDKDGKRSYFSDAGPELDVYGPGRDILSCYARSQYQYMSGTSQATPFVAGMVGKYYTQLKGKYGRVTPDLVRSFVDSGYKKA